MRAPLPGRALGGGPGLPIPGEVPSLSGSGFIGEYTKHFDTQLKHSIEYDVYATKKKRFLTIINLGPEAEN